MRDTAYGLANSLIASKEVKAPLVILKKTVDAKIKYIGFVPGLLMDNIENIDIETVKTKLSKQAKSHMNNMLKDNSPFPFFPTKEEILEEYPDTVYLRFIKIK